MHSCILTCHSFDADDGECDIWYDERRPSLVINFVSLLVQMQSIQCYNKSLIIEGHEYPKFIPK